MRHLILPVLIVLSLTLVEAARPDAGQQGTGVVTGTVTLVGGQPVGGVTLTVTRENRRRSATTDADGRFRVDGLVPGIYRATATLASYQPPLEQAALVLAGREAPLHFVLTLPALGTATDEVRRQHLAELDRHVQMWAAAAPAAYDLELEMRCFACGANWPVRFRVEQGTSRVVGEVAPGLATFLEPFDSVEDLFLQVLDPIERRQSTLEVSYDPVLGFPARMFFREEQLSEDGELSFRATVSGIRSGDAPSTVTTGQVRGHVTVSNSGQPAGPIPVAQVTLSRQHVRHVAPEMDQNGAFQLDGLAPGVYDERVVFPGFRLAGASARAVLVLPGRRVEQRLHLVRGAGNADEELDRARRLDALDANLRRWLAAAPSAYEFDVAVRCFCAGPDRVRVRVDRDGATPGMEAEFARVLAAIELRPFALAVEYDRVLGFPSFLRFDLSDRISDEESETRISRFRRR